MAPWMDQAVSANKEEPVEPEEDRGNADPGKRRRRFESRPDCAVTCKATPRGRFN